MENIILKNNSVEYEPKRFYWEHNPLDSYLHLGTMKKAIVIRKTAIPYGYWIISEASYFPFPKHYYKQKFDTKELAIEKATEYFRMWFADAINNIL